MSATVYRPRISVVTPLLDQAAFLEDAIASVAGQGWADFEHIVVDGGSTDGSLDILARHEHVRWISEPDDGQSDALNKGFRLATGDIVGWLNADDLYLPGAFETIASRFAEKTATDIVYGDCRWVDEGGELIEYRPGVDFDLFMLKYVHFLWIPSTATFFRRSVFERGEFLDIAYHQAMDYEFFLRLAMKGYRFEHVDAFLADFRLQSDSKTARTAGEQLREHRRAAYAHNPLFQRVPAPLRNPLWAPLSATARLKRVAIRWMRGHYSRSNRPGTRPDYLRGA